WSGQAAEKNSTILGSSSTSLPRLSSAVIELFFCCSACAFLRASTSRFLLGFFGSFGSLLLYGMSTPHLGYENPYYDYITPLPHRPSSAADRRRTCGPFRPIDATAGDASPGP